MSPVDQAGGSVVVAMYEFGTLGGLFECLSSLAASSLARSLAQFLRIFPVMQSVDCRYACRIDLAAS